MFVFLVSSRRSVRVYLDNQFISLIIIDSYLLLRYITFHTCQKYPLFDVHLYTIKAQTLGFDQILYPVAFAPEHRSTAFPHRVLCWVDSLVNGKNSGDANAAHHVQYPGKNVFSICVLVSSQIDMILLWFVFGFCSCMAWVNAFDISTELSLWRCW